MKNPPYYSYNWFLVLLLLLALLVLVPVGVSGWDDDDLDNDAIDSVVSVVKDVNMKNFYDMLGLSQNATEQDIRKAWRKVALLLHPDRNKDDPNANIKFQQLSAVHEILKSNLQRDIYDRILVEGIP